MQIHANATTNVKQRQAIRQSTESSGQLAKRYHVSKATVQKWVVVQIGRMDGVGFLHPYRAFGSPPRFGEGPGERSPRYLPRTERAILGPSEAPPP